MSKLVRWVVALLVAALLVPLQGAPAGAGGGDGGRGRGHSACERRNNNTVEKLLECVTVQGVR